MAGEGGAGVVQSETDKMLGNPDSFHVIFYLPSVLIKIIYSVEI